MQCLRTASGTFINAATITHMTPERGDRDVIKGWLATCSDRRTVELAPYFTLPGRIEPVLDRLPADIAALERRESSLTCPARNCCGDSGAAGPS
jgi:hypothetical protein